MESPADDLVEAVDAAGAGGGTAGLTPAHSITVRPQRVAKCPVNLEAALVAAHPLGGDDPQARGSALTIEVRVTAV
ncbi:MAG TPA: hypothetical protein VK599_11260, partial [Streptosporangiaceae bacterium]|nr:hypothetical protein [Streptosporangiaceae bacterium]